MQFDQKCYYASLEFEKNNEIDKAIFLLNSAIDLKTKNPQTYIKLYQLQNKKNIDLIYESIKIQPTKEAYLELLDFFIQDKKKLKEVIRVAKLFFKKQNIDEEILDCYSKNITLKVNNGLASRLMTLNSFYNFAKKNNFLSIEVYWEKGPGWSEDRFLDLFEPIDYIEFITEKQYEEKIKNKFHLEKILKHENDASLVNIEHIKKSSFCYNGNICLENVFKDIELENNLYSKLKPIKKIEQKINEIIEQNLDIENYIGIHIRGDALVDDCISYNNSYEEIINQYLKKDPKTKFFLATDCLETQNYFISKYESIKYNKDKFFVESKNPFFPKENQKDAIIDLYLLSKTKEIIGDNKSKFSKLAGLLKNKNVIIVKNKDEKQNKNVIKISTRNWQFPAYTEKQAWINQSNKETITATKDCYLAVPWATIIDEILTKQGIKKEWDFDDYHFNLQEKEYHTVCQHIYWRKLIPLWKKLKIKNIYVSHLENSDYDDFLIFRPWHLIGVNAENNWLNEELIVKNIEEKKYLFSFLGANTDPLRKKLSKIYSNKKNVFFELYDNWAFKEIVYDYQINKKEYFNLKNLQKKSKKYNKILSDSIFSLCPRGTGPNTIRLWESMSIGSIPVLFENNWVKPKIKWGNCSILIKNEEIFNIEEILAQISKEQIQKMQINCINEYNKIRLKTCF